MEQAEEKTRDEIYDEQIRPLMTQIIDICKKHSIPLIASFQLDDGTDEDETTVCSTILVPKWADDWFHSVGAELIAQAADNPA